MTIARVPLDDVTDVDFWEYVRANQLDGTPLYYRPFLDRKPERCVAAVTAVARAEPGGVVLACGGGRDRAGLVTILLLALVGVAPEDIVADYELSNLRLPALWAARGEDDQRPVIEHVLARKRTSAAALILEILRSLDVPHYLRRAGLRERDLEAVRDRFLESQVPPASIPSALPSGDSV